MFLICSTSTVPFICPTLSSSIWFKFLSWAPYFVRHVCACVCVRGTRAQWETLRGQELTLWWHMALPHYFHTIYTWILCTCTRTHKHSTYSSCTCWLELVLVICMLLFFLAHCDSTHYTQHTHQRTHGLWDTGYAPARDNIYESFSCYILYGTTFIFTVLYVIWHHRPQVSSSTSFCYSFAQKAGLPWLGSKWYKCIL